MSDEQSALVVAVPEADPSVARYRRELDSGAALGVPAHVTILHPFIPASMIDETVVAELQRMFASVAPFEVTFASVGWFGDQVAYLRPEPEGPFRRLTEMVTRRWPQWPPYEGRFDDAVPHLTIGDNGDSLALLAAADAIGNALPIHAAVAEVELFSGTTRHDSWRRRMRFDLGLRPPGP